MGVGRTAASVTDTDAAVYLSHEFAVMVKLAFPPLQPDARRSSAAGNTRRGCPAGVPARSDSRANQSRACSITQSLQYADSPLESSGALPSTVSTKFSIIG